MIIIMASLALVTFVLELRRVHHGHRLLAMGTAIYVLWPLIRLLVTSDNGMWFIPGCVIGPFAWKAHVHKREEALADAARRRAIREQYREIGL